MTTHSKKHRLDMLAFIFAATVCHAAACAPIQLCGVSFDVEAGGFSVQPVQPDEEAGCGRILVKEFSPLREPVRITVAVLSGPALKVLKANPSNFVVTKSGAIRFQLPRHVSDSRTQYVVRPIRVLVERRLAVMDGQIYLAEYKRRVERLKKVSDQEELEVTELQRCVNVLRTTNETTVVVAGCSVAEDASLLSSQALDLVRTASMPKTQ